MYILKRYIEMSGEFSDWFRELCNNGYYTYKGKMEAIGVSYKGKQPKKNIIAETSATH